MLQERTYSFPFSYVRSFRVTLPCPMFHNPKNPSFSETLAYPKYSEDEFNVYFEHEFLLLSCSPLRAPETKSLFLSTQF